MKKLSLLCILLFIYHYSNTQDKVGINIDPPQFTLDIRSATDADPIELNLANPSGTRLLRLFGGSSTFIHPAIFWKDGHHLRFATDAGGFTEWMRIQGNGYVGIGTINPNGQLHIQGNSTIPFPQLRLTENENDFARIKMENTAFPSAYWDIAGKSDTNENQSRLNFYFKNSTTSGDRLTIMGNGNVGIGTTSPITELHIKDNDGDAYETIESQTGGDAVIQLTDNSAAGADYGWTFRRDGSNSGSLEWRHDNIAKMTLNNAGRLGLGITIPEFQIDIRKDISSTNTGDLNIGTDYNNYFLRLFSGHNNDQSARISWNSNKNLQFGNSDPDGSNYKEFIRLDGKTIGVYNTGGSVYLGEDAGKNESGAINPNIAIGRYALYNNTTGGSNVAIGTDALYNLGAGGVQRTENTALGNQSGSATNTSGNTFIGFAAGRNNDMGSNGIYIGSRAGYNSSGSQNIMIGSQSGNDCTGGQNIFLGDNTGYHETGTSNLYLGIFSGNKSNYGVWNVYMGNFSGYNNLNGQRNVLIGNEAGYGQEGDSFSGSVMLGYKSGYNNVDDNRLYIENSDSNTPLIYGEFDNDLVKVNGEFKSTHTMEVTDDSEVLKTDGKNIIEYNPVFGGILTWGSQTDWNLFPDEIKIGGTTGFSPLSNFHITDPTEPSIVLQTGEGVGNDSYWKIYRSSTGNLEWFHSTFHKMTLESAGNLGIGIQDPNVTLDVSGSIEYTGSITDVSDIRLKKNIRNLEQVTSKIGQINPVSYEMKVDEYPEMGFEEGREYGVIAQELEPLFPELVLTDPKGFKSVDYTKLTVVLIKASQEQLVLIKQQSKRIENLEKEILIMKGELASK